MSRFALQIDLFSELCHTCTDSLFSGIHYIKHLDRGTYNMKFRLFLSDLMIPLLLFYIVGFGLLMKIGRASCRERV